MLKTRILSTRRLLVQSQPPGRCLCENSLTSALKLQLGSRFYVPGRNVDLIAEGDRVLIHDDSHQGRFSAPLKADNHEDVTRGRVNANDIIGQPIRPFNVQTSTGVKFRVSYPTLEEYLSRTPRKVTPIYSSYAASIVDLLDIHASPLSTTRLEILDAGTGHGALALHLAKSIAVANPVPPEYSVPRTKNVTTDASEQVDIDRQWETWRGSRKAIVHTIEDRAPNLASAEKVIRGFRQGLYWPHIDFHCADVKDWVEGQYAERHQFLSYAMLDLPNTTTKLSSVSAALLAGGKLCAFVPSISQIAECQRFIHEHDLPLTQLQVVELGDGISTGREWDLRYVIPRSEQKRIAESDSSPTSSTAARGLDQSVLICRPMVGDRIQGGGFVGIWQKTEELEKV